MKIGAKPPGLPLRNRNGTTNLLELTLSQIERSGDASEWKSFQMGYEKVVRMPVN
jgi:hypothetical protein